MFPEMAAFYAQTYPQLVKIARAHGYCLAIHGSMATDFDLVAVPWTETAAPALNLILAIKNDVGVNTVHFELDHWFANCKPTPKPHGRQAYSLHFTNRGCEGPYLDISVMPRK